MSEDYGPAEWRPITDYNYSHHRFQLPIEKIIVHVSGGSVESCYHTFMDKTREASYHYIVDFDGTVIQFVRERNVAWGCGWWNWNRRGINIAFAGTLEHNRDKTEEQFEAIAGLIAHLATKYDLGINRKVVKGHVEVPGCSGSGGGFTCHHDPGFGSNDWHRLLNKARLAQDLERG